MRMPVLTCNRCGKEDTMMVDAPHLDDPRVYCIECYAYLFPPGWTDEDQLVTEPEEMLGIQICPECGSPMARGNVWPHDYFSCGMCGHKEDEL